MPGSNASRAHRVVLLFGVGTSLAFVAVVVLSAVMVLLLLGTKQLADQQACDPSSSELVDPAGASAMGRASVPPRFIPLYVAAATRYRLGADGWLWLAAIHKVETDSGRNVNTSSAGAQGPMQFMPDTWRHYGIDADRDGRADIQNTADAIYGAANYLHASGAPADWHRAVFAYNHAEWYYQRVLGFQVSYRGGPVAEARTGTVAYALADVRGQIITSFRGEQTFPSASLTKAMLLVAQLRNLGARPIPAGVRAALAAMITASDIAAANSIWARVGARGVRAVVTAAGMVNFRLRTDDPVYRLGNSRITAEDQARFFARIDQLMPAASRGFGMGLLAAITPAQRWGIWQAGLEGPVYAKAGWRPEPGGYLTNQAAQVRLRGEVRGMAVLTKGPSDSYGHDTIKLVAAALAAEGAGSGIQAAPGSGCAPADAVPGAEIALTPGQRARLTPQGLAVAPQEAPVQVKAILAAGNQIVGRPYTYGGGHGPPLTSPVASYDCSSSISYILFHAGLFDGTGAWVSGAFARSYGDEGIGRWVTLRANAGHIYMYVAGLRWDTHRYGPSDAGVPGIGWHTAQRPDSGFTARHPQAL